jgi:hypothetical protein
VQIQLAQRGIPASAILAAAILTNEDPFRRRTPQKPASEPVLPPAPPRRAPQKQAPEPALGGQRRNRSPRRRTRWDPSLRGRESTQRGLVYRKLPLRGFVCRDRALRGRRLLEIAARAAAGPSNYRPHRTGRCRRWSNRGLPKSRIARRHSLRLDFLCPLTSKTSFGFEIWVRFFRTSGMTPSVCAGRRPVSKDSYFRSPTFQTQRLFSK